MAKKINNFPDVNKRGKEWSYPWNEWMDGSIWEVQEGKDFQGSSVNFQTTLHWRAKSLKRKVTTRTIRRGTRTFLVFQFR